MKNKDKWIEAKKKHKLSDKHLQMARELGINPKKLGKMNNHDQEPWKAPLPVYLEELYFKRFNKTAPDHVEALNPKKGKK